MSIRLAAKVELVCSDRTMRALTKTYYGMSGDVIHTDPNSDTNPEPVQPQTMGSTLVDLYCAK